MYGGVIFLFTKDNPANYRKLMQLESVIEKNFHEEGGANMIGRISGQYNLDALSRKKTKSNFSYGSNYSAESDNASISSFGSMLSKVTAEMKNIPEVREDVVANFRTQINNGTYNPPLDKVANALYVAGMLDMTEE